MNLLTDISIIINIIIILVFCSVYILSQKEDANPKLKAKFGTLMAISEFFYLIFLTVLSVIGFVVKDFIMASLIFFVIMLFVIGRFVGYKTLKIFSVIQLFSFALSLYVLFVIR